MSHQLLLDELERLFVGELLQVLLDGFLLQEHILSLLDETVLLLLCHSFDVAMMVLMEI